MGFVMRAAFILCLLLVSKGVALESAIEEKRIPFFEDEVSSIKQLIEKNEKRLAIQKRLKEKMELFQKQKEAFIAGNQTKSHAFSMVSTAREILTTVKEEHLSYLLSSDYLEELLFFSSIAGKTVPIKP
jgi:hypothetical protein